VQLSPQQRTHIFCEDGREGTETSLVIHAEENGEEIDNNGERKRMVINLQPRTTFSGQSVSLNAADKHPSPPEPYVSFSVGGKNCATDATDQANVPDGTKMGSCPSGTQLAGPWCTDDICALALKDIADTCTDIFAVRHSEQSCTVVSPEQTRMVEEYIASALGAPSAVFSYLSDTGDVWSAPDTETESTKKDFKAVTNSRVRNRASLLNAQATRLRTLRNEMTFTAALKKSKERMEFVQTTQSFDEIDNRADRAERLKRSKAASMCAGADRFHNSPLLQQVISNMMMHDCDSISTPVDEEVAYYDSDPEDSRPRTMYRGPRRVAAERENSLHNDAAKSHGILSSAGFERVGSSKRVSKKLGEEVIVDIVQVS